MADVAPPSLSFGVDEVFVDGVSIRLRPLELALLRCLAEAGGHVVTAPELLGRAWGYRQGVRTRTLTTTLTRLRKSLEAAGCTDLVIETVHGAGYRLVRRSKASSELLGRAAAIEAVGSWIRDGEGLLTVVGPPGVGKSALVAHAAAGSTLPILDDADRDLDAARERASALRKAGQRAIATSRRPLRVPGEHLLVLVGLAEAASAALYRRLTERQFAGLTWSDEVLARILPPLEGNPLAIALDLVRRAGAGSPESLLAGLPEEHRSAEALLRSSLVALSPGARRALGAAVGLPQPFSTETCATACAGPVEEALSELREASLVTSDGATHRVGYLVRAAVAPDEDARRRAAEAYARFAQEQVRAGLWTPAVMAALLTRRDDLRWAHRYVEPARQAPLAVVLHQCWVEDSDRPGVEPALVRAVSTAADRRTQAHLLRLLATEWTWLGAPRKADAALEAALAASQAVGDDVGIARAHASVAQMLMRRGEREAATRRVEAALVHVDAATDDRARAYVLASAAELALAAGDADRAWALMRRARALVDDDDRFAGSLEVTWGNLHRYVGRLDEAAAIYERAVGFVAPMGLAARGNLALVRLERGDVETAERELVAMLSETHGPLRALNRATLGVVLLHRDRPDEAVRYLRAGWEFGVPGNGWIVPWLVVGSRALGLDAHARQWQSQVDEPVFEALLAGRTLSPAERVESPERPLLRVLERFVARTTRGGSVP